MRLGGPARLLVVLAVGLAPLLFSTGAGAAPRPVPGEKAAFAAVRHALRSGRLDRASAASDRKEIARAVHLIRVLPRPRARHVEVALEEVAALGRKLNAPRALALVGQLRANDQYFARHAAPTNHTDITDSDGIVYRYFTGRCFEFHPLADFGALNARVAAKDVAGAERLADALVARAVYLHGGGAGWEYYFRFEGGRPPWLSGMAQAVAAQAFARAASLVTDESAELLHEASAAYRAIPGRLTTSVAAGPWIRLYSFRSVPILNAQLQSVLSLESYASATGDAAAATLAGQMEQAAAATVSSFDTGYWFHYSLAGVPSPLSYAKYVIRLLHRLASADPRFAQAAGHLSVYVRQPPAFTLATARPGAVRFWLSKPAWVRVTGAGHARSLSLGPGWHTLSWPLPKRPGIYRVHVSAVGPAGNRTEFEALPVVRVPTVPHSRRPARARRRQPAGAGAPVAVPSLFAAGVGVDAASQAAQAASLGLSLVRMTVPWQPGETAPDSATASSLQSLPAGTGLVLELAAAQLPSDDSGRAELGEYAASLAGQVPALRDLVLTPAPSLTTAPLYADALAAVRSAVDAAKPEVAVGPSVDGSATQAGKTAAALADELARDGSTADVVAFRPAPVPAAGLWTADNAQNLESVVTKRLHVTPPVLLYVVPTPATVPPSELSGYSGGAPASDGAVSPAAQAAAYAAAIGSASCSASVTGVLLDRLVDATGPEPATGLYYASGDAKPAAKAVAKEVTTVGRGGVVCPGLNATVAPTLSFPTALGRSSAVSVELGCSRDCLYLVTLDRADGRPVAALRGALAGGATAQTLTLLGRKLARGEYRVDVRLVSRVDPGTVTRRTSPLLSTD